MMILYTKKLCPQCIYVKRELDRIGVDVTTVNIELNDTAKKELLKAGIATAPVLKIHKTYLVGATEILGMFASK